MINFDELNGIGKALTSGTEKRNLRRERHRFF